MRRAASTIQEQPLQADDLRSVGCRPGSLSGDFHAMRPRLPGLLLAAAVEPVCRERDRLLWESTLHAEAIVQWEKSCAALYSENELLRTTWQPKPPCELKEPTR